MSTTFHDSHAYAASVAAVKCSECNEGPKRCIQIVIGSQFEDWQQLSLCVAQCFRVFVNEACNTVADDLADSVLDRFTKNAGS